MAVELLKEEAGDSFRIAQVTSDLDSTLDAHKKKEIGRAIERKLDQNHVTKTMSTHLHDLEWKHKELTPTVIGYLAMCFSYAIAQNKDDVKKMEAGINYITQHAFGNNDNCQEWCGYLADPNNYKHQTLSYGKDLKNEDLKGSLSRLFSIYASNAEKLSKLGSTQSNESFNAMVAAVAPKSRHYSSSDSLEFRVSTAVCKKNLGSNYCVKLMEKLKVPVNRQLQERSEKIDNITKKRSLAVNMKPAKRRRLQLKQKRKKREDVEYLKEGDTYESGIQLRNKEDVDSEKIPSFTAIPPEENIKMTENITLISVDVETTSNDNSGEIIELSATLNDNEFDQYVSPKSDISDRSSQITSLRKIGNVLLYKGSPVDTVGMRECALKLLDWLNKIDGKKILYGQNSKGCDSRMICKAFCDVSQEKEFGQSVLGYSDTLPFFRRLYPNQENHT